MKRTVYVGLPCYNEEKDIDTLLDKVLEVGKTLKKEYKYDLKIICVNDGSKDNTKKIISARKEKEITLINHHGNKGLGQAMKTMIFEFNKIASKDDYLVAMDADNTHNPKYILDLIKKREDTDSSIVISSRYQQGATISGLKKHRILISDLAKLWYSMMLKIPNVKDYTCGYRLYTYDSIDNGIKKFGENIITKTSFACMMELLYKLHLSGSKIEEIPFALEYEKKMGTSKMKILKTTKDSLITTIKIKHENNPRNKLPYVVILLMTLGLLLISCSTGIFVGLTKDAAVYLNVARNLLNGKVLYSQIVDNKGPILYFMNALFLKLGGRFGIILLEFIVLYTIFLFAYKTIKLLNDNKKHQIIVLVLMGTYLLRFFTYGLACEEYALAFSMIGLYECVKYYKNDKFSIYQCYSLGILGGLCFFIRQNLIVVFAGFGIGIFIKHIIEKRYKELIKYIIFSILGFITVALPILGYLLINNCFNDYIYYTFTLNMGARKMGIINALIQMFKMIPYTLAMMGLYIVFLVKQMIKRKELKHIAILLTVIITIFFNTIGTIVDYHYLIIFIPVLLLMYTRFLQISPTLEYYKTQRGILYLLISVCFVANFLLSTDKFYLEQPCLEIASYIHEHTDKNDTIAVVGMMDEIYFLSEREPTSKYSYLTFANVFDKDEYRNMVSSYIEDIKNRKPKVIVIDIQTLNFGLEQVSEGDNFVNFVDEYYKNISFNELAIDYVSNHESDNDIALAVNAYTYVLK